MASERRRKCSLRPESEQTQMIEYIEALADGGFNY